MKRESLPQAISLPHGSADNRRPHLTIGRIAAIGSGIVFLAGCTTLGTNIHGKFTCGPSGEGSCAPAMVIDDRALAEITGSTSDPSAVPYRTPVREVQRPSVALETAVPVAVIPAQQKVLRIIFPAHVDEAGRYHEMSIVNAIVDHSAWTQASVSHGAALTQTVNLTVTPMALSQPGEKDVSLHPLRHDGAARRTIDDPNLPTAEAVAAARAEAASKAAKDAAEEGAGRPVTSPRPFNPVVED